MIYFCSKQKISSSTNQLELELKTTPHRDTFHIGENLVMFHSFGLCRPLTWVLVLLS